MSSINPIFRRLLHLPKITNNLCESCTFANSLLCSPQKRNYIGFRPNIAFQKSHFQIESVRSYTVVQSAEEAVNLRNNQNICWNCRTNLTFMSKNFCENCESILPLKAEEDFFTLLGFDQDFRISINELQFNFKKFQVLLHPDKFSLKSDLEQKLSESVSAVINKAYFTLLKPLSRGLYLLELNGIHMTEDVTSDDPDLLDEIMSVNEQIAETNSVSEYQEIFNKAKAKTDNLTERIAICFHKKDIREAQVLLIKFKYYDNILQKLKGLIPPT